MAKVHDIIFCLNTTNMTGQGINANSVFSVLTPEYIPGLFSFSVVITMLDLDMENQSTMKIVFHKDEEIIGLLEGPLPIIDEPSNLPKEYKGINLSVDWNNMNLKEEGIYKLTVYLNGDMLKEKEIYVKGRNQK